jgi:hypothetical protein
MFHRLGIEDQLMDTQHIADVVAKSDIRDVLARYVQGVDHLDLDVLKGCYHPDAYELHHIFNGNAHDFAEWRVKQSFRSHHMLSASAITVQGARAYAETPHTALVHVDIDEPGYRGVIETTTYGWYLNLFSQRDGVWKTDFQRVATLHSVTRFVDENSLLEAPASDLFKIGFKLADNPPPPTRLADVSEAIRARFIERISGSPPQG